MIVREPVIDFARSDGLWNADHPELSHTLNAFQLALPYLEPYFIDAIKEASPHIRDARLLAEVRAFCAQEANHARLHKRYSKLLHARYPRLREHEVAIRESLIASRQQDPLDYRLAYTSAYEALTAQLARWVFQTGVPRLREAEPAFAELMRWHAAEEIEHRHVAFDVLMAVAPSYRLRVRGLRAALRKTLADLLPVVSYMLEVDGYAGRPESRRRRVRVRLMFAREVLPAFVRYLKPNFHPSQELEPIAYQEWRAEHSLPVAAGA